MPKYELARLTRHGTDWISLEGLSAKYKVVFRNYSDNTETTLSEIDDFMEHLTRLSSEGWQIVSYNGASALLQREIVFHGAVCD